MKPLAVFTVQPASGQSVTTSPRSKKETPKTVDHRASEPFVVDWAMEQPATTKPDKRTQDPFMVDWAMTPDAPPRKTDKRTEDPFIMPWGPLDA